MIIGITVGDPCGIGPEIAIKAALSENVKKKCTPLLIGSKKLIQETAKKVLGLPSSDLKKIKIFSVSDLSLHDLVLGKDSAKAGKAAIEYLFASLKLIHQKKIDAIVTCPISKKAISMAGYDYPGHTEFFAQNTKTKKYLMCFYSKDMKLALATRHVALKNVSAVLKKEELIMIMKMIHESAYLFGIKGKCKMALCALNPHAGESGIIGDEEEKIIMPAIKQARRLGIDVYGPFPSDTLFYEGQRKKIDFIIAMYHDQGLIPFKMLNFDTGVNVTLGLPFIRTSVDHGTAFDIAGKGIANSKSLEQAILLAVEMKKHEKI